MAIKSEIKKILVMVPASVVFMFGLDYFFVKDGEYGGWVLLVSIFVFFNSIKIIRKIKK